MNMKNITNMKNAHLIPILAISAMTAMTACAQSPGAGDAALFEYFSIESNGQITRNDFIDAQPHGIHSFGADAGETELPGVKLGKLEIASTGYTLHEEDGMPAAVSIPWQLPNFSVETEMEYSPKRESDIAGMICTGGPLNDIVFGKTIGDGGVTRLVVNKNRGTVQQLASVDLNDSEAKRPVTLKISARGASYSFYFSLDKGGSWTKIAEDIDTSRAEGIELGLYNYRNTFPLKEALKPWDKGAFETRRYRNLFAEAGYPQEEIDGKLQEIFNKVFYSDDRVYFEAGDSMAYISDLKNHDVRTEGMSYGMMIAVQFNRRDIFDRLWRWSVKYMQHHDGPLKGYFAWSLKTDGTRLAQGPASDGELYFVTALIFASNLWGNDGDINYLKEARHILDCSWEKDGTDNVVPLIDKKHRLITFVPTVQGGSYTDLSYHVPAFYEVWALWADDGRADFYRECARAAREFYHKATDPRTGLNPDQSEYDGSHRTVSWRGGPAFKLDQFRFDSWRVPMNVALDYSWSCADREWQTAYADRIQGFLYLQGVRSFVDQYNVDGSSVQWILPAGGKTRLRHSIGLVGTAAAVSLAATTPRSYEFIDHFWNSENRPYSDEYFDAYYDGLLQLFSFMHLSGNYRIIFPEAK
jgi:oligosaccharide reducing-end xylanase